jgi:hypothetical protein
VNFLRIWRLVRKREEQNRTGNWENWENCDYFSELVNLPGTLIYLFTWVKRQRRSGKKRKEQIVVVVYDFLTR